MGNLDFTNQAGFSWYCVLLVISGLLMVAMSAMPGQVTRRRIINALIGLAMFGYGLYLIFAFSGGTYEIFIYVFILPIFAIINAARAANTARQRKTAIDAQQRMAAQEYVQQQYAAQQAAADQVPVEPAAPAAEEPAAAAQ